jgi:hypothetical protein
LLDHAWLPALCTLSPVNARLVSEKLARVCSAFGRPPSSPPPPPTKTWCE